MKLLIRTVLASIALMMMAGQPAGAETVSLGEFHAWNSVQLTQGSFQGTMPNLQNYRLAVQLIPGFQTGAWTSPVVMLHKEVAPGGAINPSWQAGTPEGTHLEMGLRVHENGHWSNWYQMGKWALINTSSFTRTSVNGQSDSFGEVYTDTFVAGAVAVDAYQLHVQLNGDGRYSPSVYQLAAQTADSQTWTSVSHTTMTGDVDLPVPMFSQYVHGKQDGSEAEYPAFGGGGEAWCSPSSVAMVLKYFHAGPTAQDIQSLPMDQWFDAHGRINGEVDVAAIHTYDETYGGTGNWPFNTAYAASFGLDTSVQVFSSLRDVETFIKHGLPVVASLAWDNEDSNPDNDLPGASIPKSGGHLLVVRGFTSTGDVIANDPAAPMGDTYVRHVYPRAAFERQWVNNSNGTVYVIQPRH